MNANNDIIIKIFALYYAVMHVIHLMQIQNVIASMRVNKNNSEKQILKMDAC